VTISRGWAAFLIGLGVWNWIIWPRFALAIWDDSRAWSTGSVGHGAPTSFLWVHAALIVASLTIGTIAGVLGIRAWRAASRRRIQATDDSSTFSAARGK
jgi:hypothetical protein